MIHSAKYFIIILSVDLISYAITNNFVLIPKQERCKLKWSQKKGK